MLEQPLAPSQAAILSHILALMEAMRQRPDAKVYRCGVEGDRLVVKVEGGSS